MFLALRPQLGEEPDVCPAGTFPEGNACWLLGEIGASCQEACQAAGMQLRLQERVSSPSVVEGQSLLEMFGEPHLPHIVAAMSGQRESLEMQHPWAPFECFVPEESRFHLAATWLDQDPAWSYPICALACPCAPAETQQIQEILEAIPIWPDAEGNAYRLIEALEEGSGFNSEDSSIIHSPFPGNGNIRVRGRRPACHSWNSDNNDLPELAQPEEEQVWTVGQTRFSSFGGSALELRWEALSMCSWQVTRKHQEAVQILTNVSGAASGSGKTTLLNVLAGRQSGGQRHRIRITGQVWISGQRVDPRMVRSRIAYVMQKDEMFATSTPTEALSFSASLRLSGPREDRKELISELLGSLGLRSCAHTYIGNAVLNGLSGGQRKRTAIGVELITRPDIVCLDEPTSGLDSFAAYQVMNVLTDLAKAGCTVICTLHQPSSEIFALIDQVICLCSGHCLWAGDRDQMASYFTKVGYPCPVGFNPADFVIFIMQTEPKTKTDELIWIWTQEQIEARSLLPCGESLFQTLR
eukprot:symbB.v1.2.011413.t1/scaffold764.1/size165801/19